MTDKRFWITLFLLADLGIYLFVSAPPPLEDERPAGPMIPVTLLFRIVEAENDAVLSLWTREIVGQGKRVGLRFDEHWRDDGVEAGPLPALFLRETARSLEKGPVRLSLFLGSDYPIRKANRFEGLQQTHFQLVRQTVKPRFFFMQDLGLYVGMFPDVAISQVCVDCHNRHENTPKTDWRLNDVMGATTWMYPKARIPLIELLQILSALKQGFRDAYTAYLDKVRSFRKPPLIGDKWPRKGYFLPSTEVFMATVRERTAPQTLPLLLEIAARKREGTDHGDQ